MQDQSSQYQCATQYGESQPFTSSSNFQRPGSSDIASFFPSSSTSTSTTNNMPSYATQSQYSPPEPIHRSSINQRSEWLLPLRNWWQSNTLSMKKTQKRANTSGNYPLAVPQHRTSVQRELASTPKPVRLLRSLQLGRIGVSISLRRCRLVPLFLVYHRSILYALFSHSPALPKPPLRKIR